ncbi:MAG: 50S ribosomal protein L29 [Candidatus Lokiarchaeota archaeon]|nr:50S ribosomal protein L29 [Candidatus Lokiarchaeota archaeon]
MTAQDIRKLTPAERQKKLEELYDELASERISLATGGGTENPYRTRIIKKAIARILTVQREEELGIER